MVDSLDGVADIETLRGPRAEGPPTLLVEAPHGATLRAHYDALADRMRGPLPDDLHEFFHVNTDVGSWELGRRVAERVVQAAPTASVRVVRCLLPRTLIDVNRVVDADASELSAAVPPYIRHPDDRALLLRLHAAYTDLVERAYAEVCGAGGQALVQHTYGPVTLGIQRIDDDIVRNLRAAHEPGREWPERAEVDLITRDEDDQLLAPPRAEDHLRTDYAALGVQVVVGGTYYLHPSTMGRVWSARYPGQVLCLEVRRDLLVEVWRWNQPMDVVPEAIDRFAGPLAAFFSG